MSVLLSVAMVLAPVPVRMDVEPSVVNDGTAADNGYVSVGITYTYEGAEYAVYSLKDGQGVKHYYIFVGDMIIEITDDKLEEIRKEDAERTPEGAETGFSEDSLEPDLNNDMLGDDPSADDPNAGNPVVNDPDAGNPIVDDPFVGNPIVNDPDAGNPIVDDPFV
ncbi:MAG: hypothetical protein ACI4PG_06735, partial [Candidatus Ventricola sp.]